VQWTERAATLAAEGKSTEAEREALYDHLPKPGTSSVLVCSESSDAAPSSKTTRVSGIDPTVWCSYLYSSAIDARYASKNCPTRVYF
jgi:hypothetical protein